MDKQANSLPRKLAAIFFADVVGYSAMSNEDEESTHLHLRSSLDRITDLINSHAGRVVNYAGDAVLGDFPTASAALACAIEVQKTQNYSGGRDSAASPIQFRIGINLGEVILDRDDVYGDGVNVAARIEALADPGGICISESAISAIGNKMNFAAEDIGLQTVKNIAKPIHCYCISFDDNKLIVERRKRSKSVAYAGLTIGLGLAIAFVGGWFFWLEQSGDLPPDRPVIALSNDMPSIAVLPFRNLNDDKKQEYFSDGITNDIINDLSRFSKLSVIASNSVFVYKGKAVKVGEVGVELGVTFVLEGTIQRANGRVRINAQLIDVATNRHKWAERYEVEMTDIFSVQDTITNSIVTAMQVVLTTDEKTNTASTYTTNIEAYDLFLRGRSYLRGSRTTHKKARELFDQAIDLDPDFAAAYAEKSLTYFNGFIMPMSSDPEVVKAALFNAEKAVELDSTLPLAQARLGWALLANRRHDEAIAAARRSVELGPNDAEAHVQLGNILNWSGEPEAAIREIETAIQLNPHYPFYYLFYLGHSHYLLGNNDEAISLMERVVTRAPHFIPVRRHLAVLYSEKGIADEARKQTEEVFRIIPGASIQDVFTRCLYRWNPQLQDRFIGGLRKSGMPEGVEGEKLMKMKF